MSADHHDDGLEEDHEEHENHEAWVIPYADMLTLLMALFLMLFAISSVDLAKFEKLSASLAKEFGQSSNAGALEGGPSVFEGAGPGDEVAIQSPIDRELLAEAALQREEERAEAQAAEDRRLDAIERHVLGYVHERGLAHAVTIRRETRGLIVTVVADQVVFEPGRAQVRPDGRAILTEVAAAVRDLPNQIVIEGHTDSVPIHTAEFRSNWELSTARATEVLRILIDDLGLHPHRVAAAGYGEERPIAPNDTAEGRRQNRRVEMAVLSEVPPGA